MEPAGSASSSANTSYFTIATPVTTEIKVKNSRFISFAHPIGNLQEYQSVFRKYQKQYHDASHICFAYRLGVGTKQLLRYSDAGEPAGSAGAPILKVIEGANITNIVILVVRYFGGVKLGVGGLVRAYTKAAKEALHIAKIIKKEIRETIRFTIMYEYLNNILHEISVYDAKIIEQNYSDQIKFSVSVPKNKLSKFKESLVNKSSGKIIFVPEKNNLS